MKIQFRLWPTTGLLGHMEVDMVHNTLDNLRAIDVPTLVITGTKDRLVRPSCSEVIANLIPNAKLVRVDGGSHGFFIEMSDRFNKEVLDFLRA
jgi:pimeloyl-ACP methyl ester carboxylesterase